MTLPFLRPLSTTASVIAMVLATGVPAAHAAYDMSLPRLAVHEVAEEEPAPGRVQLCQTSPGNGFEGSIEEELAFENLDPKRDLSGARGRFNRPLTRQLPPDEDLRRLLLEDLAIGGGGEIWLEMERRVDAIRERVLEDLGGGQNPDARNAIGGNSNLWSRPR